ncbi:type III secretion system stator protein SctL [Alcaligenes faecalis]|uniref:type III secretion system stator protein SctL n=1 Tax=Alcaligenes TaxID=507 RepID=UPI0035568DDB
MSADTRAATGDDALIIRAESLAAWQEGERFLEQARQQAQAIQKEAHEQADHLREQARQEGYETGRRAAMEEAAELTLRLAQERERYVDELEPRLVQLIDTAFRKILDGMADAELVERATHRAVGDLRESGRFTLRLAPGALEALSEDAMARLARVVVWQEDDKLRQSQCFLETPAGIIELTPHAQWDRILKVLQQHGVEQA